MGRTVQIRVIAIIASMVACAGADVPQAEPVETPQPQPQQEAAPAPVAPVINKMAEMLTWRDPHGGYMLRLRQRIIAADQSGDIELRDRLLAIYAAWAAKYLDPKPSDTK